MKPERNNQPAQQETITVQAGAANPSKQFARWAAQPDELPPDFAIGKYTIVEHIGSGGMGDVYHARHKQIGREVAIKVLKAEMLHQHQSVRRMLEEARVVNAIKHPNIIEIHDFVEDFTKIPPVYIVMELLQGVGLNRYIEQHGIMDPSQVVSIGCKVADAVQAVHDANVLHRDLKTSNIYLAQGAAGLEVKVLDFGAVRTLDREPDLDQTQEGMIIGTPSFMAPEQFTGQELDERTDIYSLGVVLYRMLTASEPHPYGTEDGKLVRLTDWQPTPMAELRPAGAPVPRALEQLVLRCMSSDAERRPPSMRQLSQALERAVGVLGSAQGESQVVTLQTRAGTQTHPVRWATLALLVAMVAVAMAVMAWPEASKPGPAPGATISPPEAQATPAAVGVAAEPLPPPAADAGSPAKPAAPDPATGTKESAAKVDLKNRQKLESGKPRRGRKAIRKSTRKRPRRSKRPKRPRSSPSELKANTVDPFATSSP